MELGRWLTDQPALSTQPRSSYRSESVDQRAQFAPPVWHQTPDQHDVGIGNHVREDIDDAGGPKQRARFIQDQWNANLVVLAVGAKFLDVCPTATGDDGPSRTPTFRRRADWLTGAPSADAIPVGPVVFGTRAVSVASRLARVLARQRAERPASRTVRSDVTDAGAHDTQARAHRCCIAAQWHTACPGALLPGLTGATGRRRAIAWESRSGLSPVLWRWE